MLFHLYWFLNKSKGVSVNITLGFFKSAERSLLMARILSSARPFKISGNWIHYSGLPITISAY